MKPKHFLIVFLVILSTSFIYAQDCDSLISSISVSNTDTAYIGTAQIAEDFLYGKLEIEASSPKWVAGMGFQTDLTNNILGDGIMLLNGYFIVFKTFPESGGEYPSEPQFKRIFPIPDWDTIKKTNNRYVFIWQEGDIDLVINDTLLVPHEPLPQDSIPNQPMQIVFRTNINLDFKSAGTIDTLISNYICYNYLTPIDVSDYQFIPKEFSLSQNYPNPFNPETTIRYKILSDMIVSLFITNVLGQKVRTLVDSKQVGGNHSVIWNGRDDLGNELSSGVYFYNLIAGDLMDTKKLTLIK